jgi:Leucine-rich repeat (LRR) protein
MTLGQNSLSGDISFLQPLKSLSQVFLSRNNFTGQLNFPFPSQLSILTASANQLSGAVSLNGLTLLQQLVLSSNLIDSLSISNCPAFYTLTASRNLIRNVSLLNLPNCIHVDLESNLVPQLPDFAYYTLSSLPRLYTLSLKSMFLFCCVFLFCFFISVI